MVIINNNNFNTDSHTIVRFIIESKIKYSFLYTPLVYSDINQCLKYLINKSLHIDIEPPFELEYMRKIVSLVVKSSLNIENVLSGNDIIQEELILRKLEMVLEML